MSPYHDIAESRIQEAMAAGEFDGIDGRGKKLDLDGYFAAPEGWRMGFSVLRSAGVVPEEVELLKELQERRERLAECQSEAERQVLRERIAELTAVYELKRERYRRRD